MANITQKTETEKEQPLEKIIKGRKEKLAKLESLKINPYPSKFEANNNAYKISDEYKNIKPGEISSSVVKMCGRLILRREMGKAIFANLKDSSGTIQIYVRSDSIGNEQFDIFAKLVDLGDFIGVEGTPFRTRTGEMTVLVKTFVFLSKALRPLPEKWHGIKDVEISYRQRYLDLLSNEDSRKIFAIRSKIISFIRQYLNSSGFLEVETPMMQSIPGGALARPFITRHNAYDIDLYMRIAPELSLKKLIVGGMEKVYELGKSFRNEGVDRHHNPEFTMLEIYKAYSDCKDMLNLCKEILKNIVDSIPDISAEKKREFSNFREITLSELSKEILNGVDIVKAVTDGSIRKAASGLNLTVEKDNTDKKVFDHIFSQFIQPTLKTPTFVTDYPLIFSPLAKKSDTNSGIADRFELFAEGEEIANAYSELNDPEEQRRRFSSTAIPQDRDTEEHHLFDKDFIEALEYGMPPCGGLGIGIDRLTMILTCSNSIRDVILFPLLRPGSSVET